MRLLVVDDDEVLRCMVGEFLTEEGHAVDLAVDGMDALASIQINSYDAVVCDWEMPRMDGPTLCRAVRAGPNGRNLYVIMLTSKESIIDEANGYDAGIDAFISKPCDPTDLRAALRTAQSITGMPMRKAS